MNLHSSLKHLKFRREDKVANSLQCRHSKGKRRENEEFTRGRRGGNAGKDTIVFPVQPPN